jgi:predicted nucleic acid-binding protein
LKTQRSAIAAHADWNLASGCVRERLPAMNEIPQDEAFPGGCVNGVVLDTNVFVAAGFNPRSAAARILTAVRQGRLQLIWSEPTRRETEMILRRIPRLEWDAVADIFRPQGEFTGPVTPGAFGFIADPDDRKFAALSAAAKVPLVTNDNHLLAHRDYLATWVLTPRAFLAREPLLRGAVEIGHAEPRRI